MVADMSGQVTQLMLILQPINSLAGDFYLHKYVI
ncbi:hypothetical protein SPLC1_S270590 [Arthrospira platensis C1]|nr:hypothetical protein SPLC1_S270590 [Arthrospira platensis C1]